MKFARKTTKITTHKELYDLAENKFLRETERKERQETHFEVGLWDIVNFFKWFGSKLKSLITRI